MKRKRGLFVALCAVMVSLALAMPALAQDKKKDKPDKVWGKLVSAPADPSGKLAAIAIETQKKEVLPLLAKPVIKKMEKIVGQNVEVEGRIQQMEGKKVLDPWTFVRKEKPDEPKKPK